MRYVAVLLIVSLIFLTSACSQMPEIRRDEGFKGQPAGEICCRKDCLSFVQIPYRLIHSIEARLPDGKVTSVLGVVLVDPQGGTLHCVLMTPEGFVLLDAMDEQGITSVRRGVPPFDQPTFAAGVMADIRLMLLPPTGPLQDAGRMKNGDAICRYSDDEGRMTDLVTGEADRREIRQYDAHGFLRRLIHLSEARPTGLFGKIELDSPGSMGYTLHMNLLEAEPVK